MPFTAALLPVWLSSAWRPSNVELYVLNSVYLDGNGAELATSGDVGVFSFVTDGDFLVGVDEVVGFEWSMAVFVIVGELKSNDNRDLLDTNVHHVMMIVSVMILDLPWRVDDVCGMIRMLERVVAWWRAQVDAVPGVRHHHRRRVHRTWHIQS